MDNFFYWLTENPITDEVQLPEVVDPECYIIDKMIAIKVKALFLLWKIDEPDIVDYYSKYN